MVDKYYTPTIEEFHVGFECEILNGYGEWSHIPVEYSHFALGEIKDLKDWRVKHLDKEDIESLGFTRDLERGIRLHTIVAYKDIYELEYDALSKKVTIKTKNMIRDGSGNHQGYIIFFRGTIKNKSELKRILKQLEI